MMMYENRTNEDDDEVAEARAVALSLRSQHKKVDGNPNRHLRHHRRPKKYTGFFYQEAWQVRRIPRRHADGQVVSYI